MNNCENISKLISEQQDQELKTGQKIAVWTHLSYCKHCRQFKKQMDVLSQLSKEFKKK